jgi:hypothetical protein
MAPTSSRGIDVTNSPVAASMRDTLASRLTAHTPPAGGKPADAGDPRPVVRAAAGKLGRLAGARGGERIELHHA